ncbi:MAG: hypothetical protein ACLTZY_13640 [Alistipes indistinctus]
MDPNHRDRIAFLKICSGVFERNKSVPACSVRQGTSKFAAPTAFMAEKEICDRRSLPGRYRRPARHGQLQDRRHVHRRRTVAVRTGIPELLAGVVPLHRKRRPDEIQATGQRRSTN